MSDPAFSWLLQQLQHSNGNCLWLLDENAGDEWRNLQPIGGVSIISNRWDLAAAMQAVGWRAQFSDFDLSAIPEQSLDAVFYRISKEKAVVQHLLEESWRCLKPEAQLYLAGQKQEGIKTWLDKAGALLGSGKQGQKQGLAYVGALAKQQPYTSHEHRGDYHQLQAINAPQQPAIMSKPGQFGWNKADQGSALLIANLEVALQQRQPHTCLDIGCGYGYLSLHASRLAACAQITHWTLTDNNAAALHCAAQNLRTWGLKGDVVGDNCGEHIHGQYDLLLCNPPFHQGFEVEGELTQRFINTAHRLLAAQGLALFVVNAFIPLEKKAASRFRHCELIANNGRFKVLALSH